MFGKQILSLALLFLVATNVEIITGILPWIQFHVGLIQLSIVAAIILSVTGLVAGRRTGGGSSPEVNGGRTKRTLLVGMAVMICVFSFALGMLSETQQQQLQLKKERQGRLAILLHTYHLVDATNWSRARSDVGSDLVDVTRDYENQFGVERGTNRFARLFAEARDVTATLDHRASQAVPPRLPSTNVPATNNQFELDPVTGCPIQTNLDAAH